MSYLCAKCETETDLIARITNLHITGDPKKVTIRKCDKCGSQYLFISISARMSYGDNDLLYRFEITDSEAEMLVNAIKNCPDFRDEDCNCPAHKAIDNFEKANFDRRICVVDDKDIW